MNIQVLVNLHILAVSGIVEIMLTTLTLFYEWQEERKSSSGWWWAAWMAVVFALALLGAGSDLMLISSLPLLIWGGILLLWILVKLNPHLDYIIYITEERGIQPLLLKWEYRVWYVILTLLPILIIVWLNKLFVGWHLHNYTAFFTALFGVVMFVVAILLGGIRGIISIYYLCVDVWSNRHKS